ncbi:sucrase ferredoxin [uncultured Arthrobacter sp.]|uniref:sucrase ferredoxin n=1 Tax=uncultured Arthrobacter sp. TaxID=114050 RepID=UPI002632F5C0|nr:sucrase ferredoxin [uncultured Arthrobacter sp.]
MPGAVRFFCSNAARERADPIAGTAPRGLVWILIEYRGGWPPNGFDGLDLEPGTKARVFSAAQAQRARILLMRRPGRRTHGGPGRWAVLRHDSAGAYRQQWGTWDRDEDLAGIAGALERPGELGHPPVVLVCTHGQHDVCCSVRGRPVARALGERWPELVWECAHVGGDRFAATVVVAPDGVYYGNLDEEAAVGVVEGHLADRIGADHLRGYTDLPSAHQAAICGALGHVGPAGRNDYIVAGSTRDGDTWRVRLTGRPAQLADIEVEVQAHRTPPRQLTCRGAQPSPAIDYELVSVRQV